MEITQREAALQGMITPAMAEAAQREQVEPEAIRRGLADGTIVLPYNRKRAERRQAVAFGKGLRTKVSASIGLPLEGGSESEERKKLEVLLAAGADAVLDLSIGAGVDRLREPEAELKDYLALFRRHVLSTSTKPVGTLPQYEVFACRRDARRGGILATTVEEMFDAMERHAAEGVDFFGLHSAMTLKALELARRQGRLTHMVSWAGASLAGWMLHHQQENPFHRHFDRVLDICRRYDVTLSLADGLRPGSGHDSLDRAQVQEMVILGEQVRAARDAGVQVMVKGPGHAPLHHCHTTVQLQKQLCEGAPYFIFGPLATDAAPGYDHITCAIGAALAASAGADLICYVTPAEHVRFPTVEDVRTGVISARIAAHAADVAKGFAAAVERDAALSQARGWQNRKAEQRLALDPDGLVSTRSAAGTPVGPAAEAAAGSEDMAKEINCHACGDGCSRRVLAEYFRTPVEFC
ncbi:phosphomethylpyrimidine synthase ThiC [Heliobacterium gestii]|uniref:Phosphomethylpyrimidine synthase ThiC n=1 Tax=Heliomicrobium gestii TaxID=2699 RepID=A0A845LKJ2_HELGE|nr:phosphomethylpyrimidine synthase ThiC [Heliomicrobium gestii]MBM7867539.1 phosphomethylpyrimidine synthase [Heliomicrobium gestii]MZP43913.1 phosphomethylpyrimidine synthase ThiC [Heliomicrobium gestii]